MPGEIDHGEQQVADLFVGRRSAHLLEFLEQGMTRGQFWFTMEYVEGTNLEVVADAERGSYPIAQACRMAKEGSANG